MRISAEQTKIDQAFIHTLRLLQYEQRKIMQLLIECKRPDLKELLESHLSECEVNIDRTHSLISVCYNPFKY